MAAIISVKCPRCQAGLKLKTSSPTGKKVTCPKCSASFVVKTPAPKKKPPVNDYEADDDFDEIDDLGGDDFSDDEFDAPPRKSRAKQGRGKKSAGKKKRKKQGMSKGLKIGLFAGGGVLGVAVVGLLIWLVVGLFSAKLDLAYLPEDADDITVVRYAEIWNSKDVQEALEKGDLKSKVEKMKDEWGFEPKDVVSLTSANNDDGTLRVLRTSVDLDEDKILKQTADPEEAEHGGETYHRFGRRAIYFPDARTAVSGSEEAVKSAIDRGPKAAKRDDLAFVDAGHQHVRIKIRSGEGNGTGLALPVMGLSGSRNSSPEILVTGQSHSSTSTVVVQAKFANSDVAADETENAKEKKEEQLKKWEDGGRNETKSQIKRIYSSLSDEDVEKLLDAQEATLKSMSISRSGDVVKVKITSRPPNIDKEKLPIFFRGEGASRIDGLVGNPGQLFGISRFQRPNFPNFPNRGPGQAGAPPRRPNQVHVVKATVGRFRGNGDQEAAVRRALSRIPDVDQARTQISGDSVTFYLLPGRRPQLQMVQGMFRAEGFNQVSLRSETE